MTNYDPANPAPRSLAQDLLSATRYYLRNRFVILAIAAVAVGLALKFNWGWLVAAGIAPILLTFAPCAAMCALGLCMSGGKRSQVDDQATPRSSDLESSVKPPLRLAASSDGSVSGTTHGISSPDLPDRSSGVPVEANKPTTPSGRKGCC